MRVIRMKKEIKTNAEWVLFFIVDEERRCKKKKKVRGKRENVE